MKILSNALILISLTVSLGVNRAQAQLDSPANSRAESQPMIGGNDAGVSFSRILTPDGFDSGQLASIGAESDTHLGEVEFRHANEDSDAVARYAAVDKVVTTVGPQSAQIMVSGNYSNSCAALSEVRVQIQQDVIVLQPMIETSTGDNCVNGIFPFSSWTSLDFLRPGRFLIHIRTTQGRSLNSVIDVPGEDL